MRRSKATIQQGVIDHVRILLDRVGERFRFEIVEAGVRQDDLWWYVPVIALSSDGRELPQQFATNVYANVEQQVADEFKENVLIIPALP